MDFYSNVPLAKENICPSHLDHNRLARQFNLRLKRSGPDCAWRIFYYADSIFLGMRNTATPQVPLGVSPAEDEWWKVYMNIEYPTGTTGEGNWPLAFAGTPQGANVMNPLNAFIFGRKTAENKLLEKIGPWAEGNNFDGAVDSTRAVLSNRQYWESAFRQRGAIALNPSRSKSLQTAFEGYDYHGRKINAKYLVSPYDNIYLSTGLFTAGRSGDKYFTEYASNTLYMRYPPSVKHGVYVKYGQAHPAPDGVLKRKNAAKDLLNWGLWVYTYYFRGAEQQRSLLCEGGGLSPFKRNWKTDVIALDADKQYAGQHTPYVDKRLHQGPLTICDIGFDFFKYFTRQNVFAPSLGISRKPVTYERMDGIGNPRLEQYRVTYKYEIPIVLSSAVDYKKRGSLAFCHHPISKSYGSGSPPAILENYDTWGGSGSMADGSESIPVLGGKHGFHGKTIRFKKEGMSKTTWSSDFLMKCSYDNSETLSGRHKSKGVNFIGSPVFSYQKLTGRGANLEEYDYSTGRAINSFDACLAGYYLETTAVENDSMKFKLRIWGGSAPTGMKIVHETVIKKKYSYAVNRNANRKKTGKRAYIYNKIYYFKEGLDYKFMRFEIVPTSLDNHPRRSKEIDGKPNPYYEKYKGNGLISFGNPFSSTVDASYWGNSSGAQDGKQWSVYPNSNKIGEEWSHLIHQNASPNLETGDMVKIKFEYKPNLTKEQKQKGEKAEPTIGYVHDGQVLFVRKVGTTDNAKLYFYERQDDRLNYGTKDEANNTVPVGPVVKVFESLSKRHNEIEKTKTVTIEKMLPPTELFKVTLDLAVLAKAKPTFHDLYALLRATTDKQNRRNTSSNIILGDGKGIGTVGHHFTESKRVWQNYYKYGSAMNIYGSSVVPALRMYISANPIYESMRKFVSSFMRLADRRELINYTIEGGRGVLYFRRYAWGLPKRAKATVLRNMEPPIDPAGWFYKGTDAVDTNDIGHAKFIPIKKGKKYKVVCEGAGVTYTSPGHYKNKPFANGTTFWGGDQEYLDTNETADPKTQGAFEVDGIHNESFGFTNLFKTSVPSETNEWIMFMTSSHYHWANSNIYKPSIYNDIMGFLNNRCHHRSKEYERGIGDQYDMVRTELCRVMPGPRNDPGPRLHIFMSKSSSNLTYVFNTNSPYEGNLHLYAEHSAPPYDYYRSCPPTTPKPYRVVSTRVVASRAYAGLNPSCKKINDKMPSEIIKVVLDKPLRKTGRLSVGRSGWRSVNPAKLQKEPYRTDENAVIEYLHHMAGDYSCKRNMIGDHGAQSDVVEGSGYRPFGACYPRFYFLKLIPKVQAGAVLNTEPYAQMDFYLRAMGGAFINPYATPVYRQTSALNWQFGELASRSVEEDPSMYEYIDPRSIQS